MWAAATPKNEVDATATSHRSTPSPGTLYCGSVATAPLEMFERVLSYCGFSAVLGPGVLARALADEGVMKETATVADYRRALPRIEARIAVYLPAEELPRRVRRIVGYLAFVEGELDVDDEQTFSRIGHSYQELKARAEAAGSRPPTPRVSGVVLRDGELEAAAARARGKSEKP